MTDIKAYENLTARQQLNLFRNLYYTDGNATENGIVAWAINKILPEYTRQRAEIEKLKADVKRLTSENENLTTAKAEAIKEFLQKIESEKWNYGEEEAPIWVVELIDLNRIAKEMTGDQNDG